MRIDGGFPGALTRQGSSLNANIGVRGPSKNNLLSFLDNNVNDQKYPSSANARVNTNRRISASESFQDVTDVAGMDGSDRGQRKTVSTQTEVQLAGCV